jgi:hypothetical protein
MTMTKTVTEVAPPRPSAARGAYTQHLSLLVDVPTREYILGLADAAAKEAGYKFLRQGEIIRELLAEAIIARHERDPAGYAGAVVRGREILAEPTDGATPRRA